MKFGYEIFNTGTFGIHKFGNRIDFCFGYAEISVCSKVFKRFKNGMVAYNTKKGFEAEYFNCQ